MEQFIRSALALSSWIFTLAIFHQELIALLKPRLTDLAEEIFRFLAHPPSPSRHSEFEEGLQQCLRRLGRDLMEFVCNRFEGDDPSTLPSQMSYEGIDYRLNRDKTNQPVDTVFGPIVLRRHLYRPSDRESAESSFAPLSLALGIVENTTPGLADKVGRSLAEAGATQQGVQERLQRECGVSLGTGRLRDLSQHLAGELSSVRRGHQVEQLLGWLKQAYSSAGKSEPVLSVGRDGIMLGIAVKGGTVYEVASTATVTVLDRSGKRLGTAYLAYVPESKQVTLSEELTELVREVLRRWEQTLPCLCYVTDAGDNETRYYQEELRWINRQERSFFCRTSDRIHEGLPDCISNIE